LSQIVGVIPVDQSQPAREVEIPHPSSPTPAGIFGDSKLGLRSSAVLIMNRPSCARDTHGARRPTPLCQDSRRRRAGGQHGSALRRRSHSQSRGTLRCSRLNRGSSSDSWAWRTSGARGITPTSSAFTQAHGVARLRRAFIGGKSSHFGDVLVYLLVSGNVG
jgi:hypothetical protein